MRLVLAVLLLAACGPKTTAPAWPKMADKEADGGESLAPRAKAASVAAASSDDDVPVVTAVEKPAVAAKPDAETPKPATATPAQAPDDIIITTEEIIIEIDD